MRTPLPTMNEPLPTASPAAERPPARSEEVVRLEGIRKSFGKNEVLHGVDLSVHRRRARRHLRPVRIGQVDAAADDQPARGAERRARSRVFGVEYGPGLGAGRPSAGSALELRRHVGMVFQQFNLFPHLTALDNVALALRTAKRMGRDEAEERAARALQQVGPPALGGPLPGASSPAGSSSASRSRVR